MNGWFVQAERLLAEVGDCAERGWHNMFRASVVAPPGELKTVAEETMQLARTWGDVNLELIAHSFQGLALVTLGEVAKGMNALDETMALVTSGEILDYMTISEVFCLMLSACDLVGDWGRTEHWCQVANDYAKRHQCSFLSAYCRTTYGSLQTATGQWQDAEATPTEAIRAFEVGHRGLCVHAILKLAELRIYQGRLEEAEALLIGYEDYGAAILPLARLYIARNEPELARKLLEQALASSQAPTLSQAPMLLLLIETLLIIGVEDQAQQTLDQLINLAQNAVSESLSVQVLLVEGNMKRAAGEPDAAKYFRSAIDHLQSYEQSFLAGRARLEMARTLQHTDPAGAVIWARAAYASFMRQGATHDADETLKILRELGVSARTLQGSHNPHRLLTPRESEVLKLLGHGLTNREIAERLFVSTKTVEHHVSQILSKLGVRSRAEAVAFSTNRPSQDPTL